MRKTATHVPSPRLAALFRLRLVFLLLLLSAFGSRAFAYDLTVAKDGSGNYTTVQAAVNAVPTGRTTAYTIFIKDGIYAEKVTVPSNKPFVQLVGQSVANTILTWNDNALTSNGAGGTLGTGGSASVTVNSTDFSAINITFVNSFGDGSQAVAVSLYADRAAFKNCRFLGNQDTLLTYGAGSRQYFKDCYIDGNVDFIFGNAVAIFDNCTIYAKSRSTAGASFITAANTPAGQTYGYLFRNARIPSNTGATLYYLGRPWQNSTGFSTAAGTLSNPKVIFMKARFGYNQVQPAGWVTWDAGTDVTKITYAEYRPRYFGGNNVNVSQRVSWSQQLTPTDTLQYTTANMFGAWDPCTVAAGFCTTTNPPDIAVANFRATKGTTQTTLNWNISWAQTGIQYDLLRSSDNINFSQINTVTATNDSTYNFQMTDVLPVAGTAYYYKVRASKAGLATHTTPAAVVSSIPTITVTGTPGTFTQYQGTPSAVQTYTVSGANMTDNLTITAPAGYEISINGGTSWSGSGTPIVLTATANTIANTTVSVRLNGAAPGAFSGNIAHTSNGAATVNVAVTGSRVTTSADPTVVLEQWPLTADAVPTVVAAGVTPSSPTLSNLNLLDGSTAAGSIPGYSATRGQAIAPLQTGGGWTSGTLSRTGPYEEFTIVADATHTLRVDSLVFTSSFYNSLNGRLGVSYSLTTPFTPTEVTGGVLPDGGDYGSSSTTPATPTPQPAGATGGFTTVSANATLIPRRNNGPLVNINTYRLALNSSTGVTVAPGQTLTLRMYFALGSTSTPRPAFLMLVSAKGTSTAACNAAFTYPATTYCTTAASAAPTVTGTVGGTFASTTGLSLNAGTGAITPGTSTPGTYTVTYNASASCSSTATVTITAAPTANIGYSSPSYCTTTTGTVALGLGTGSTRGTVTANPATGLTMDATGAITPGTSTPGTYFITNTVAAAGGCAAVTGGTTVTITAPATAGFSYGAATYCTSATAAAPVVLATGASAGTFSSTAGLTINASTGAITPSTSTPGTYTVTNTVAASGGCAATTSTATVTITAPTAAGFSYAANTYCTSVTTTVPVVLATGAAAGTFTSASGLTVNASTGAITPSTSTPGTYTVTNTVAASGACAATTGTATVIITGAATAGISYAATSYCTSATAAVPVVLATGASTGVFSSTSGLTINATTGAITPSTSTPGTYTVTNTVAASGGCAATSGTTTVTITAPTAAGFSYAATSYCRTATTAVPVVLATGAAAGAFTSASGLTINATTGAITPSTSTPGTYTVTNTVAASGGCAATSATTTVTITAPATAGFSYAAASYCTSATAAAPVVLATGATAGAFSSTAGLSINATTGAITPSTSTPGTYTVTNTVAASGGCAATSSTATVAIVAPAVASFTYPNASYCLTAGGTATPTLGAGSTAGTFSSGTGLAINAATGAINLGTSTPGTYTVTNTVAASGACAAVTATATVTVAPAAVANAGPAVAICSGASATLGVAPVAGTTYSYSPATGLSSASVANPTVTLTNTTGAPITQVYTLTATTAAGCTATASVTVTVNPAPVAAFSYPAASYCASQATAVTPTLGTGSTAGTFSSTTGLSLNASTGAITPGTSTAGTYVVTNQVTNASGCATSATFSVTINATPVRPTVSAAYGSSTATLTSSAATGNQWYLNGVLIPGATGQTYVVTTPAQVGSYTVVTTSAQGCASQASAPLVVTGSRAVLGGTSLSVFPNPTPDGHFTVELLGYRQAVTVSLFNAVGQLVLTRQVAAPAAGAAASHLELTDLAAGVYVLRATTAGGVDTRRVVVGR